MVKDTEKVAGRAPRPGPEVRSEGASPASSPFESPDGSPFKRHVGFPIRCRKYYADPENVRAVARAVRTTSIRSLEWFVLNYAKKYDVTYPLEIEGRRTAFNVYADYRAHLESYGKKYFDPFCRESEDVIEHEGLRSTPGQLNFFHWALTHDVLANYKKHATDVERDMRETLEERRRTGAVKRRELSRAVIKKCVVRPEPVTLSFD